MISANGVEYKNLPEQVQYLTEKAAEFAVELGRVSASVESVNTSVESLQANVDGLQTDVADMQTALNNYDSRINAVESTVAGLQTSLTTAQNTANVALTKAESALSMIAGLHSLTKEEVEFEGDIVTVTGFVEGSLCTLTKLEGNTKASRNLINVDNGIIITSGNYPILIALPAGTYTISASVKCVNLGTNGKYQGWIRMTDANDNKMINTNLAGLYTFTSVGETITINKTFTISEPAVRDTSFIDFGRYIPDGASVEINNVMLNLGSTALDYIPYFDGLKSVSISGLSTSRGVVITTSEGTTSLVPTLDDDTLELRAYDYLEQTISGTNIITSLVRASGIVDLGALNWDYITDGNYPIFLSQGISNMMKGTFGVTPNVIISSKYTLMASTGGTNFKSANYNGYYTIRANNRDILIQDTSHTDAATFKSAMSGVYLVYERATPVTTVLATVTYTDVSAFFEAGAAITVNNANTEYGVESTSTMYGYVAE